MKLFNCYDDVDDDDGNTDGGQLESDKVGGMFELRTIPLFTLGKFLQPPLPLPAWQTFLQIQILIRKQILDHSSRGNKLRKSLF